MIEDEIEKIASQFDTSSSSDTQEAIDSLNFLATQCKKIPTILDKYIKTKCFSQNDTLASSVYVDINEKKQPSLIGNMLQMLGGQMI